MFSSGEGFKTREELASEVSHYIQQLQQGDLSITSSDEEQAIMSDPSTPQSGERASEMFPNFDSGVGPSPSLLPSGVSLPMAGLEHIETTASLKVYSTAERDGILVSVTPPKVPALSMTPGRCDIVLLVDVSPFMGSKVPPRASASDASERNITILDLVKHAARFVIEALDEKDRVSILTYSSKVVILHELLQMTPPNKQIALSELVSIKADTHGSADLCRPILSSLDVFRSNERSNVVPAIMILTAGDTPNVCATGGCIKWLQTQTIPASIYTFGFGQQDSFALLKAVAEVGSGVYSFVADEDMIASVFVNSLATMQSTYATDAILEIDTSHAVEVEDITGLSQVEDRYDPYATIEESTDSANILKLDLGILQYGQSRDIFLCFDHQGPFQPASGAAVFANAEFMPVSVAEADTLRMITGGCMVEEAHHGDDEGKMVSSEILAYHRMRGRICQQLNRIFALDPKDKEVVVSTSTLEDLKRGLYALAGELRDSKFKYPWIEFLQDDFVGEFPKGQILKAVSSLETFNKWGRHHLFSVFMAHQKQICNSFTAPGPLQYGAQSPLFVACRDTLDSVYKGLGQLKSGKASDKAKA